MLHIPETAHLYALLNFAQISQAKFLEPELESYLIKTLLRFSEMPSEEEWSLAAADFERLKNSSKPANIEFLRDIADYCLISSGLMAGHFSGEKCNYEKFQQIGMDAFTILSEQDEDKNNIYIKISRNFSSLVKILRCSQSIMHEQFTNLFPETPGMDKGTDSSFCKLATENLFDSIDNREITYH